MIIDKKLNYKSMDYVDCYCDNCKKIFKRLYKNIKNSRKKRGIDKDYCASCASKLSLKPQNTKEYWTDDKKIEQSKIIKSSDKYYESLKTRDMSGIHNGMFNKKHTDETKRKMSLSRIGKIGDKATAWKGGKTSLIKRIKGYIHKNVNWYFNVYKRDNFTCQKCGSKSNLDAHHIIPISKIVKDLLKDKTFNNDNEKFLFLINQEKILDKELKNGITLCRDCHKKQHKNWGSHKPIVENENE